jgi:hypothetical protein
MVEASGFKTGHLKLTHGYACYSSLPDRAHAERGVSFCFDGEVDRTNTYTVAFDNDQLGLTPCANVPRILDYHQALLEGEPTNTMVGSFEANEANVHTICSRSGMFIPFELVDFCWGKT